MHKVTVSLLRELTRLAAEGVPQAAAARLTGEKREFVQYWAKANHVTFQPRQNRGMPAWLLPEMARQAEAALRRTCERVCHFAPVRN